MRSRCSFLPCFLVALMLPALGCGGGLAKAVGDASAKDDKAADADAAKEAATRDDGGATSEPEPRDAGSSVEASAPPDGSSMEAASGACNALANAAALVTVDQLAEDPPAPLGGTVVNGTYVLTGVTIYTGPEGPSGPSGTARTTITITGSTVEVVSLGTPPTRTTTLSTSGTTFTSTDTCPDGVVAKGSFTATPTALAIFLDGGTDDAGARTVVEAFTKE